MHFLKSDRDYTTLVYVDMGALYRVLDRNRFDLWPPKLEKARAFLATARVVDAPRVALDAHKGVVRIIDGSHRLAALREAGVKRIGVEVDREDAGALRNLLSSRTSSRVPKAPPSVRVLRDGFVSKKLQGRWRPLGSLICVLDQPGDFDLTPREVAYLEQELRRR